jgi:hypothetical protein
MAWYLVKHKKDFNFTSLQLAEYVRIGGGVRFKGLERDANHLTEQETRGLCEWTEDRWLITAWNYMLQQK